MNTDASVRATRRANSIAPRNPGDTPISPTLSPPGSGPRSARISSRSRATAMVCAARPYVVALVLQHADAAVGEAWLVIDDEDLEAGFGLRTERQRRRHGDGTCASRSAG